MNFTKRRYTSEQLKVLVDVVSNPGDKSYLDADYIRWITKTFNEQFNDNRTDKAIAAQLRDIKTELKLPVSIAFRGISDVETKKAVKGHTGAETSKPVINIPALLKTLGELYGETLRQNTEMRRELQKLAKVRSAIDDYRGGGRG